MKPSVRSVLGRMACLGLLLTSFLIAQAQSRPNIVFILADDLGYGDVHCLNANGKISTPHLDRLASQGMVFTDAHSSSAVCSPSRYSILTGRYNWRSRLQQGVLGGYSRRLIEPGRMTVAALLQRQGYHTAAFGKWHLGMDWPLKSGGFASGYKDAWKIDYSQPIEQGPNTVGFDYFFGISASLDMPPFVFIENNHCVGIPTVEKKWIRKGPASKDFEAINVLPTLTRKVAGYIHQHAHAARAGHPFFVYFAMTAPHTPIVPLPKWQGKSHMNAYADFVMQVDASVGDVLRALHEENLASNTWVIFTSDNGCSPAANFAQLARYGHDPSYIFRGEKADIYEGGHHIPFITRWPGKIKPGSSSPQLICLSDFMATCANILGMKLPSNAGEDSVSILPALEQKASGPLNPNLIHHSINGSFAIRQGPWKLELCPGSGGWSGPHPGSLKELGLPPLQLYDLATDIGERSNLVAQDPAVVKRLAATLSREVNHGRSTPGPLETNTVSVNIWRAPQRALSAARRRLTR